jgi:hypothetical protein
MWQLPTAWHFTCAAVEVGTAVSQTGFKQRPDVPAAQWRRMQARAKLHVDARFLQALGQILDSMSDRLVVALW